MAAGKRYRIPWAVFILNNVMILQLEDEPNSLQSLIQGIESKILKFFNFWVQGRKR